ncbi:MAG: 2-hydroxyacyl-CoA dehydratase family protein [Pseudomonadota bacterium]
MTTLDLPQLPDEFEALGNWTAMIRKLQRFLEETFDRKASDRGIEAAVKGTNHKNRIMRKCFDFAALHPPLISWQEMYDLVFLALPCTAEDFIPIVEPLMEKLERRKTEGFHYGRADSPICNDG